MEIQFTQGNSTNWLAEPELVLDRRIKLGDKLAIEGILANCTGWIGDAPFAIDAEREAELHKVSRELWRTETRPEFAQKFIFVTFGVRDFGGILKPRGVGLELVFRDDDQKLNPGQRIQINSVFPSALFHVWRTTTTKGEVDVSSSTEANSHVTMQAELTPPGILRPILTSIADISAAGSIKNSSNFSAIVSRNDKIFWSAKTYAPVVEALGEGDTRAAWFFHHASGPLAGKTLETTTGITVGRDRTGLEFRARMSILFEIGPFPIRRYSHWVNLSVEWDSPSQD